MLCLDGVVVVCGRNNLLQRIARIVSLDFKCHSTTRESAVGNYLHKIFHVHTYPRPTELLFLLKSNLSLVSLLCLCLKISSTLLSLFH